MSLIQAGQLRLPNQKNGRAEGTPSRTQPLPYLGAVGTIPLSVSPMLIRHHPGASPNGTEKAADVSR
ncbi:MAG: hypothetical protein QOJ93_2163 [Actinomycetota bacterium]|jgi:hypothetical protein|nr:hypothetical protein [Actinomycetota bacterium]